MPSEEYRIEIDVEVHDHTNPSLERAQQRVSRFERATARTDSQLQKLSGAAGRTRGHMDHLHHSTDGAGRSAERAEGRFARLGAAIVDLGRRAMGASGYLNYMGHSAREAQGGLWSMYKMMLQMSVVMAMMTATTLPFIGAFKGLQIAGEMDRARRSIIFYSGSVKEGRKNFEDFVNFAIKSPIYEVPFVVKTAGQLMATGQTAKFAKRALQAFGNTAMYTGASLEQLELSFYGFKQIAAVGTLSMEELRQVTENLNLPMSWVAKELGVAQKDLKNLGKLGIPAAKAMEAIIRTMEKRFPMKDFNADLLALVSNVKESGRTLLWAFGEGMSGPVIRILQDLANKLDPTSKGFRDFAASLKHAGEVVGTKLEQIYKKIKEFLTSLNSPELKNLSLSDKIIYALDKSVEAVDKWLAGPGGQKVQAVFVKLATIAGEAWMKTLIGLVKGSGNAFSEGNILGGTGLLLAAGALGGGAVLRGAWGAGKGVWKAGKWLKNAGKATKGAAAGAEAAAGAAARTSAAIETVSILGPRGEVLSTVAKNAPEAISGASKAAPVVESTAKGLARSAGKGALRTAGKVLLPVALTYDAYNIATAKPGEERAGAIGGAVGGFGGGAGGAAAGAAIGAAFGGVGAIPGAIIGGLFGGIGGSIGGEYAGRKIYEGQKAPVRRPTVTEAVFGDPYKPLIDYRPLAIGIAGKPLPYATQAQGPQRPVKIELTVNAQPQYKIDTSADPNAVLKVIRDHQTVIADDLAGEMTKNLEGAWQNMLGQPALVPAR